MSNALLPAGFAALEPFADRWAAATGAERAHLRAAYLDAERDAFHAACAPLLEPALTHLDGRPLTEQGPADRRLMRLLLSFAHVCLAVEIQGSDEARHNPMRASMRITRTPADE